VIAAEDDAYDLFILYLGGHGRREHEAFQFLFFAEDRTDAIANASDIDAIISLPKARNLLLLLDACHAGKYGEETTVFRSVESPGARLCIVSSLTNQKSWEDSHFRRSLFADAVAKALTEEGTAIGQPRRVTGELFDNIAADVAKHAFALKRSIAQEPAIIGASTAPFSLPTVTLRAKGKPSMTTYEVLARRSRQVLVVSLCIGAILMAAISIATWRPAINDSGYVELRPGPKWLSPLNIGPWKIRVETDLKLADLKGEAADPDLRADLSDEHGIHVWPGINSTNIRRWADIFVDEFLSTETAARWRVRLGYAGGVDRLITTTRVILPTQSVALWSATKLAAEAKLLQPSKAMTNVWRLQWRNNVVPGNCRDSPLPNEFGDQIQFYLHLSEPTEYVEWLHALALTARADESLGLAEVAELVEMFTAANRTWRQEYAKTLGAPGEPVTAARIAIRFTERPTRAEVAGLAAIAKAIVGRRIAASHEPVTPAERSRLVGLMDGCGEVAAPILAALGKHGDPELIIAWARERSTSDQGRAALRELAPRGALPDKEISWVLDTLGFSGNSSDRKRAFVNAREWLEGVADVRPLSTNIVTRLIDYALERKASGDKVGVRQVLGVISESPVALNAADKIDVSALKSLVPQPSGSLPPTQEALELIGLLARSGIVPSWEQRDALITVLENSVVEGTPRVSFTKADKGKFDDATDLVTGATLTHLLAFSRLVIGSNATDDIAGDPRTLPFLNLALSDAIRFGVHPRPIREVVAAIAIVWERSSKNGLDALQLRNAIRCCPTNVAARIAQVEVVTAALLLMSQQRRYHILDDLREYWMQEREPENKLALAEAIIRTVIEANDKPVHPMSSALQFGATQSLQMRH